MLLIKKNFLGTLDITAKFKGMRKEQEFTSYAMQPFADNLTIQSDTRIGYINIQTGVVSLCKPKSSGAYFHDLNFVSEIDVISIDDIKSLKTALFICAYSK